ncbi:hypothetical protein [Candidatus Nitrosocosmicus arcticus]|nr:hypothetical protein [Candidatus Nitrosocosmicus arcticus]
MSNITISARLDILTIFVTASLITSVTTFDANLAFADKNEHNGSEQVIDEQGQYVSQGAQCVSGEAIILSCNNLGLQSQNKEGNWASGQQ